MPIKAGVELAKEHTDYKGEVALISGTRRKWRKEFYAPLRAADWIKSENGITIPDPSGGLLTVAMGTTIGAEGSIVSTEMFSFPVKATVGIQLSQKIANNEIYVEMVGCDANGVLDETRVAAWRIAGSDSTNASMARVEVNNGAGSRRQSGNVAAVNHVSSVVGFEITCESDEIWFSSKLTDSVAAKNVAQVMNQVSPDPDGWYKLRVRFKNGTTAPASNTNVSVSFALVVDFTEQQVEVTGGNGNSQAGQSIPVTVISGGVSNPVPSAGPNSPGTTVEKINSAATTNAKSVKTSAGRLYGYSFFNSGATVAYVKIHNNSVAPTPGALVGMVIPVPPMASVDAVFTVPVTWTTGIGYTIVAGSADTDTTAVSAGQVVGYLLYA